MSLFLYLDTHYAIEIHDDIIDKSGGLLGVRDIGLLDSILCHIQNDNCYPTFEEKLTHLFYSINKGHAFVDGNKRSSIALSTLFMELNGYSYIISKFIVEMENITLHVADNRIDKPLLKEIICSVLFEGDFSDDLKLRIISALNATL